LGGFSQGGVAGNNNSGSVEPLRPHLLEEGDPSMSPN
jgi:hypothetical protein